MRKRFMPNNSLGLLQAVLIYPIKLYKYCLSPLLGNHCRFTPTCSVYAIEVIKEMGCWQGAGFAMLRIFRCHPWHRGGYDPVPKKSTNPYIK